MNGDDEDEDEMEEEELGVLTTLSNLHLGVGGGGGGGGGRKKSRKNSKENKLYIKEALTETDEESDTEREVEKDNGNVTVNEDEKITTGTSNKELRLSTTNKMKELSLLKTPHPPNRPPVLWVEASPLHLFQCQTDSVLADYNRGINLPFLNHNELSNGLIEGIMDDDNGAPSFKDNKHPRDTPVGNRLLSRNIREAILWMGAIQLIPQATMLKQELIRQREEEIVAHRIAEENRIATEIELVEKEAKRAIEAQEAALRRVEEEKIKGQKVMKSVISVVMRMFGYLLIWVLVCSEEEINVGFLIFIYLKLILMYSKFVITPIS